MTEGIFSQVQELAASDPNFQEIPERLGNVALLIISNVLLTPDDEVLDEAIGVDGLAFNDNVAEREIMRKGKLEVLYGRLVRRKNFLNESISDVEGGISGILRDVVATRRLRIHFANALDFPLWNFQNLGHDPVVRAAVSFYFKARKNIAIGEKMGVELG